MLADNSTVLLKSAPSSTLKYQHTHQNHSSVVVVFHIREKFKLFLSNLIENSFRVVTTSGV